MVARWCSALRRHCVAWGAFACRARCSGCARQLCLFLFHSHVVYACNTRAWSSAGAALARSSARPRWATALAVHLGDGKGTVRRDKGRENEWRWRGVCQTSLTCARASALCLLSLLFLLVVRLVIPCLLLLAYRFRRSLLCILLCFFFASW